MHAGGGDWLPYFGGAGANPSRLRPGSGLGLGFGAFLTSFLPLSLLPMRRSVPQEAWSGKELCNGKYLRCYISAALKAAYRWLRVPHDRFAGRNFRSEFVA